MLNKVLLIIIQLFALSAYSSQVPHLTVNTSSHGTKSSSKADELNQDFNKALNQINLVAGDDIHFWGNNLKIDLYARYAQSSHFSENMNEMNVNNLFFPQQIIARDVLKAQHLKIGDDIYEQALLYQAAYSWGDEDVTFTIGRFSIIFGDGYFLNPINPLNHSQSIAPQKINQVNDGAKITFHTKNKLKLHLYFLGDKRYSDYNEEITRTVMLRGEWKQSKDTEINYILGEDQKRHKYGVEIRHELKTAYIDAQAVRYSQKLNDSTDSAGLFHYLLSLNKNFEKRHKLSLEFGKFQRDKDEKSQIKYNYLPFESFAAAAWSFQVTSKLTTRLDYILNSESDASLYNISATYSMGKQYSVQLFALGLAQDSNDDADFLEEDLFPSIAGLNLQGKF